MHALTVEAADRATSAVKSCNCLRSTGSGHPHTDMSALTP